MRSVRVLFAVAAVLLLIDGFGCDAAKRFQSTSCGYVGWDGIGLLGPGISCSLAGVCSI